MLLQTLRTIIFYLCFLLLTAALAIAVFAVTSFARGWSSQGLAIAKFWGRATHWLLHRIAGIRSEITGAENIPAGPCIIASKHQSDWEIFAIVGYCSRPAYIAKKELFQIPVLGQAMRAMNCIPVDRKRGRDALPDLLAESRSAIEKNSQIVIFPEGTRKPPLVEPNYKTGVARLYDALQIPVVPVAVNSGFFWGRGSRLLWPGLAQARFLPPIAPGLSQSEFLSTLIARIEHEADELALQASNSFASAPMSPQIRARLTELAARRRHAESETKL